MKRGLLHFGFGLVFTLSLVPEAIAVEPVSVSDQDDIKWSQVIDHPFDGRVVYDRHYTNDFLFISSWSKSGIRATYTQFRSEFVGYRTVWRSRPIFSDRHDYKHGKRLYYDRYTEQEPVYRTLATSSTPKTIQFAINGQKYVYENGPVPDELAIALASALPKNMLIRLTWDDGKTRDIEIGKGTVTAWRTIFQ